MRAGKPIARVPKKAFRIKPATGVGHVYKLSTGKKGQTVVLRMITEKQIQRHRNSAYQYLTF